MSTAQAPTTPAKPPGLGDSMMPPPATTRNTESRLPQPSTHSIQPSGTNDLSLKSSVTISVQHQVNHLQMLRNLVLNQQKQPIPQQSHPEQHQVEIPPMQQQQFQIKQKDQPNSSEKSQPKHGFLSDLPIVTFDLLKDESVWPQEIAFDPPKVLEETSNELKLQVGFLEIFNL